MQISEYQRQADVTDVSSKARWVGLTQNAFGLSEKVGEIAGAIKLRLRDKGGYSAERFRKDTERYIGEALWYLSAVATHFNADLEVIALRNLDANRARWDMHRDPQGRLFHGRASASYPPEEQWPPRLRLEFIDIPGPSEHSWLSVARVTVDGVPFGDPIDDNTRREDGYRYHDILHYAFAACLDWSPVVRKLMSNKRKSKKEDDKFEDGARAGDTEEAVSNMIHKEARDNNFFLHAKRLPTDFLNSILVQVKDLEVRDRTPREWERCILAAYAVYRRLLEEKGGFVDVDFENATLTFTPRASSARDDAH